MLILLSSFAMPGAVIYASMLLTPRFFTRALRALMMQSAAYAHDMFTLMPAQRYRPLPVIDFSLSPPPATPPRLRLAAHICRRRRFTPDARRSPPAACRLPVCRMLFI